MPDSASVLGAFDRLCSQFAVALQQSELKIYAVIVLAGVLGILLFPPKNDPDQI